MIARMFLKLSTDQVDYIPIMVFYITMNIHTFYLSTRGREVTEQAPSRLAEGPEGGRVI